MTDPEWSPELEDARKTLETRLANRADISEMIDIFEKLMAFVWAFIARMLGNGGVRAIMNRALSLSGKRAPIVTEIKVLENGLDFDDFRQKVAGMDNKGPDVAEGLIFFGLMVFKVITDLTGDILTEPLLRQLEEY